MSLVEPRQYVAEESAVFFKTKEKYGGLSNMASGFPLYVNGCQIKTSEALYQACRFPRNPEIQQMIISERSPMTAKMKSKPYRDLTRSDWIHVRIKIMRWALRVKLCQNWESFSLALLETGDRPIVEKKVRKIDFWGATEKDDGTLHGKNVLGRLLMELRDQAKLEGRDKFKIVEPLSIPDFLLFGKPIELVIGEKFECSLL